MKTGTTVRLKDGSVGSVERADYRATTEEVYYFRPEETTAPHQTIRPVDVAEVLTEPEVELIDIIEPLTDAAVPIGTHPSDWALNAVSDWDTSRPEVMRGS